MPSGVVGKVSPGDGATFTPHIASNGDLTWTNNGGLENPQSVNIRGPQGSRGLTGATGPSGPQGPQGPPGQDGAMSWDDLTEEQKAELVGPRYVKDEEGYLCLQYPTGWFD